MLVSARYFLDQGYPVARMNMRGAGPGQRISGSMYHAGLTEDLAQVIARLKQEPESSSGILAQAVSLGANMLLKYLGERGTESGLLAAVSISAPIDLKAAQVQIERPRNFIYHKILLNDMLRGIQYLPKMRENLPGNDLANIQRIYEFDNAIVAGYHGYDSADHYYRINSARPYLGNITCPSLVIHAQDDPWIPEDSYQELPDNPALQVHMTHQGGHVGFHDRADRQPWHDRMALRFFEKRLAQL